MQQQLNKRINSSDSSMIGLGKLLTNSVEMRMTAYVGWQLFKRDIKARYRKTLLGYLWAIIPALTMTLTFVFLQKTKLLNAGDTGTPYPVYAFLGAIIWRLITTSITSPMTTVQSNMSVMAKVYFPRLSPLLASLLLTLFDLLVNVTLAPIVMITFGVIPDQSFIFFPVAIGLIILSGMAVGIMLTPLNMIYQDINLGITLLLSFLALACPVGYAPEKGSWLGRIMEYNPFAWLIDAARNTMTAQPMNNIEQLILLLSIALPLLCISIVIYLVALPIVIERYSS